ARDGGGARAIFRQVQTTFGDSSHNDAGGFAAIAHFRSCMESGGVEPAHVGTNSAQSQHEIINHPVGIGMVDVEAIEFTVCRQVNASLSLKIEYDARGVKQRLLARQGDKPIWRRIGTDSRGENPWRIDSVRLHGESIDRKIKKLENIFYLSLL